MRKDVTDYGESVKAAAFPLQKKMFEVDEGDQIMSFNCSIIHTDTLLPLEPQCLLVQSVYWLSGDRCSGTH